MTSPVPDLLDIQQWFPPVEKTVCGKRKRPSSTRLWTMRNIKKADDFNYYIIHIIHLDDTNSQHHVGRSGTLKDLLDVIEIHVSNIFLFFHDIDYRYINLYTIIQHLV